MIPEKRFVDLPKKFWALVRLIGQECGYTEKGRISIPSREQVSDSLKALKLNKDGLELKLPDGRMTWDALQEYFEYRSNILHRQIEPNLMNAKEAEAEYIKLKKTFNPKCPLPLNKQKGDKKAPAYLTCIVNMLIEAYAKGYPCDYDPRALTTVTTDGFPLRTFARRMDGAFPSIINPISVWEVKEYYYTTTFGSRVADGVYESLLDGMEIEELADSEKINVLHYLMIDAYYTWWDCGKSYLCRIVDMLHMGYVDEVLIGREVITRLPVLVREWIKMAG